jgi:hypothetical protein
LGPGPVWMARSSTSSAACMCCVICSAKSIRTAPLFGTRGGERLCKALQGEKRQNG